MDGRAGGWENGRMDMAAICQTTRRQRASEGGREEGRGDGGSDLAVASGVADSAADIVAGDLTPGRSISPIPTDCDVDGGGGGDGWGN